MSVISLQIPAVFRPIFSPSRFKILYGGRGSGKSWSVAIFLITAAVQRTVRIMCCREIQLTINDSVKQLLESVARLMGLQDFFQFKSFEIVGRNGSIFSFRGLRDLVVQGVKSSEGYDYLWIEEGQYLTETTIRTVIPTIRAEGSEILISFNPCLPTDPVWQEFVICPRPGSLLIQANYTDNPFFSSVLEAERQHDQRILPPEDYAWIWLGQLKTAVDGAIYAGEIAAATNEGRTNADIPYDPLLAVHVVFDLGYNDDTCGIVVQLRAGQIRVIDFFEDRKKKLSHYATLMKSLPYPVTEVWLPHDAFAVKDALQNNLSYYDTLLQLGIPCRFGTSKFPSVPRLDVSPGIMRCREVFPRVVFGKKAEPLLEHLRRYRRDLSTRTGLEHAPLHDLHSHAADAFRYLAVSESLMAETVAETKDDPTRRPSLSYSGPPMMPF